MTNCVAVANLRTGLRERKKFQIRQKLASAALRLAMERGLDNITIEDITAEADVAPRTFSNYFSSKYEAICAGNGPGSADGASLLARLASEPLWEALTNAVLPDSKPEQPSTRRRWTRSGSCCTHLSIRGEYLKTTCSLQTALAVRRIAERDRHRQRARHAADDLARMPSPPSIRKVALHPIRSAADPVQLLFRPSMLHLALQQLASALGLAPSPSLISGSSRDDPHRRGTLPRSGAPQPFGS